MQMFEVSHYLKCLTNKRHLFPIKELVTKFILQTQEFAVKYGEKEMDIIAVNRFLNSYTRYETPEKLSTEFAELVNKKID